jgi:glutathione S-transferase
VGVIKLYQYEISPFCDKVRRVLHLKGQPFETHDVSMWSAGSGFLERLNPAGRLPVLEHDGRVVCDSTDIVAYLERTFPEPPVYPTDSRERAEAHVMEDWADESLYFYEMYLRFNLSHNVGRWVGELSKNDGAVMRRMAPKVVPRMVKARLKGQGLGTKTLDVVLRELDAHLRALDGWLGDGEWLVGERISIADVSVFVQLDCVGQVEEGRTALGRQPRVRAWLKRVAAATAPA